MLRLGKKQPYIWANFPTYPHALYFQTGRGGTL